MESGGPSVVTITGTKQPQVWCATSLDTIILMVGVASGIGGDNSCVFLGVV